MSAILHRSMWIIIIIIAGLLLVVSMRLLLIKRSVETYKAYWAARAEAPIPADSILYVALGDSAAQGIGASKPEKGYVGLIATKLAAQKGKPVHVVNISATGATAEDVIQYQLPVFRTLPVASDTVVTLDVGANDTRNFRAAMFRQQIDEVLSQLPAQTVVADVPYFGGGRHNKRERAALEASAIIREVAQQYGISVAPLHDVTRQKDGLNTYAGDFFHPNDRGYRNWYEAFRQPLGL